jgi:hypothetical protein
VHLVTCKNNCGAVATITQDGVDIHDALDAAGCTCCPLDHHHGQASADTGTPCRPVTVLLVGGGN